MKRFGGVAEEVEQQDFVEAARLKKAEKIKEMNRQRKEARKQVPAARAQTRPTSSSPVVPPAL